MNQNHCGIIPKEDILCKGKRYNDSGNVKNEADLVVGKVVRGGGWGGGVES